MAANFTPLDTSDLDKKYSHGKTTFGLETLLLLIGTFTALVLAFLLFVLIQKKMQASDVAVPPPSPAVVAPTETPISEAPVASPSVSLSPSPTYAATPSASITPTSGASSAAALKPSPTVVPATPTPGTPVPTTP